eukprot:2396408-Rhodomonas_salina.1
MGRMGPLTVERMEKMEGMERMEADEGAHGVSTRPRARRSRSCRSSPLSAYALARRCPVLTRHKVLRYSPTRAMRCPELTLSSDMPTHSPRPRVWCSAICLCGRYVTRCKASVRCAHGAGLSERMVLPAPRSLRQACAPGAARYLPTRAIRDV